ncbi:hypothetical protein AB3S75_000713 [Citrus x aurantiifolia]
MHRDRVPKQLYSRHVTTSLIPLSHHILPVTATSQKYSAQDNYIFSSTAVPSLLLLRGVHRFVRFLTSANGQALSSQFNQFKFCLMLPYVTHRIFV